MGQGENPMEKFLSSAIIVFALGITEVQAKPATDCETKTIDCQSLSLTLDETKEDKCTECLRKCAAAKIACLNGGDQNNLDTAALHSLYCKKHCKKHFSSSKGE